MNADVVAPSPLTPFVKWSARVTSLLLFGLVVAVMIGHEGGRLT
jgi:hypothetical protein